VEKKKNILRGLSIDGRWEETPREVKREVNNFFEKKISEVNFPRPSLDGASFKQISKEENQMLIVQFGEQEIKKALWECDSQCPGPDGIHFNFLKTFWETMKEDTVRFISEFLAHGMLPRGTNTSFITPVRKVEDPQNLSEFKPISLVGCMYKVLAKPLANKMKRVMNGVIDQRQSAILGDRYILHSTLVANKAIEEAKREKKKSFFSKLIMKKLMIP